MSEFNVELSIVIPLLDESQIVQELIARVTQNANASTLSWEIIIIDDGSSDDTWKIISEATMANTKIKALKFSRNFGHHFAITAGIHHSSGNFVIVMDGDLQDRPELIPNLYAKAKEGNDVVFVSRIGRTESFSYRLLQRFFYFILNQLSGVEFNYRQANFSIISRNVVNAYKTFGEQTRFYSSTIKWLGFRQAEIFATHDNRFAGKPSYTWRKRFQLASEIILSFSQRPLKIAITVGIIFSILSMLNVFRIIFYYLRYGYEVTGWASLITSIFFTSGVTLIVLGIIGLYLGQVFIQVKNRPLFVIEKKLNI